MAFNFRDYAEDIKAMSKANGTDIARTVEDFIVNLTVMCDHYPGASQLNFHQLGQQWNKLLSRDKLAQKKDIIEFLTTVPVTVSSDTKKRRSREVD